MLKLLHCADVHLDTAFSLEDAVKAEVRRSELRATFTSLISYVREHEVDLVLIAGDLFDREFVTPDTIDLLSRSFESCPKTRFVIAPGNHDPYTPGGVYARTDFPDNVYVFSAPEIGCFSFDDLGCDVYGYAFTGPSMESNPLSGRRIVSREGRINLLCAHADLGVPLSRYCPLSVSDLRESGVDYAALGHIHASEGLKQEGDTYYAYSGCLEGRDFGETGLKGALYLEIEKDSFELRPTVRWKGLPFSGRRFAVLPVDMTGAVDLSSAADRARRAIREKGYDGRTSLRLILQGELPPDLALAGPLRAMLEEGLFYLEVRDDTLPVYDTAALADDPTIRGAFFRKMRPLLEEGSAAERRVAAMALRYGLCALDGRDVTDLMS